MFIAKRVKKDFKMAQLQPILEKKETIDELEWNFLLPILSDSFSFSI